jgi:superfamily I DNA/RNA helicase
MDESHLLLGPAGSGKTNLLLLRSAYLIGAGRPNVVVLMFTRKLCQFLARGAAHYRVPSEKIMTILEWEHSLLYEHNVRTDDIPNKPFDEMRAETARRVKELVARKKLRGTYECILVDEVQDCLQEEIDIFFELGKRVFLAGDMRQRIYTTGADLEPIRGRVNRTTELKFHYRCGLQICGVADAIAATIGFEALSPTCNYRENLAPSSVEAICCPDMQSQCEELVKRLTTQLRTYPGELLGVACPKRDQVEAVESYLESSALGAAVVSGGNLLSALPSERIVVTTMHAAKGLEFRTMSLLGLEELRGKELAYTGITRARTTLSLSWSGNVRGWLEQAAHSVRPIQDPPTLDSLFDGGR